jgi:membrane protein implicated in regulation of membrane protease activity
LRGDERGRRAWLLLQRSWTDLFLLRGLRLLLLLLLRQRRRRRRRRADPRKERYNGSMITVPRAIHSTAAAAAATAA